MRTAAAREPACKEAHGGHQAHVQARDHQQMIEAVHLKTLPQPMVYAAAIAIGHSQQHPPNPIIHRVHPEPLRKELAPELMRAGLSCGDTLEPAAGQVASGCKPVARQPGFEIETSGIGEPMGTFELDISAPPLTGAKRLVAIPGKEDATDIAVAARHRCRAGLQTYVGGEALLPGTAGKAAYLGRFQHGDPGRQRNRFHRERKPPLEQRFTPLRPVGSANQ